MGVIEDFEIDGTNYETHYSVLGIRGIRITFHNSTFSKEIHLSTMPNHFYTLSLGREHEYNDFTGVV